MMKLNPLIFAALLCIGVVAQAEVSLDTTGSPASARNAAGLGRSAAPDATPSAAEDLAKDLPSDAKMLSDHLTGGDSAGSSNVLRALTARAGQGSSAAGTVGGQPKAKADGADQTPGVMDVIKENVRPIKEQIDSSEAVQAVRELDLKLSGRQASTDSAAPVDPTTTQEQTRAPTSAEQAQRNKIAADLAMQQLIDEVKPWAFGLVGLLVLGYLATVVWHYLAWKGKRRNKARRLSTRSRRSTEGSLQGQSPRRSQGPVSRSSGRREHRSKSTPNRRSGHAAATRRDADGIGS
jgi:hypothetical protein